MPIEVVTFGCRLNAAESDAMRAEAVAAGLVDLVIVNTCAVTAEAARDGRRAVRRAVRDRPGVPVAVTGCAAETERARFAAMPEVSAIVRNAEKTRPETWRSLAGGRMPATATAPSRPPTRTRALLPVQNGCDHRCTFCIIPFGRGPSRSVPLADAAETARRLVEEGAKEIVLTGVDLTSWGDDLPDRPRLGALVKAILRAVPDLARLRLSSIDSVEADDDLLDALATEPRLMPHLHLALQAGDDLVLKRMKRRHGRDDAIRFCARVLAARPDVVFGADLIAGFPTETEAMFRRSLDIVAECGLTHLHVFPYSARPGTPAARMPPVPPGEVKERARRLRERGDGALRRHLAEEVGEKRRVLAEAGGTGRTEGFAPVRLPPGICRGEIVDVTIAGHDGRTLLAA